MQTNDNYLALVSPILNHMALLCQPVLHPYQVVLYSQDHVEGGDASWQSENRKDAMVLLRSCQGLLAQSQCLEQSKKRYIHQAQPQLTHVSNDTTLCMQLPPDNGIRKDF